MKTYVYCINGEDVEIAASNREEADKIADYKFYPQRYYRILINFAYKRVKRTLET